MSMMGLQLSPSWAALEEEASGDCRVKVAKGWQWVALKESARRQGAARLRVVLLSAFFRSVLAL